MGIVLLVFLIIVIGKFMAIRFLAIVLVVTMAGCAMVPESIQVADDTSLVDYKQVAASPDTTSEKTARWGGVITKVENLPKATMIEVLHYPLRGYGRPVSVADSAGRFRVYVDGFLDPMIYEQGRTVTFTGKVLGTEEGLVGEHNYVFPTLKAVGYHLWKDIERVDITHFNQYPFGGYYGWPRRPLHSTVIIRSSNQRGTANSTSSNQSNRPANKSSDNEP
jgi:outer membrane lipoprotein